MDILFVATRDERLEHPATEVLVQQHSNWLLLSEHLAHDIHTRAQKHDRSPRAEQVEECEGPACELDEEQDGDAYAEYVGFGHDKYFVTSVVRSKYA